MTQDISPRLSLLEHSTRSQRAHRRFERKNVQLALITILISLIAPPIHGQSIPPYPPSRIISSIRFDWSSHARRATGSDNFPITWADDNNQYTTWGDGWGFCDSGVFKWFFCSRKKSLGVARISGSYDSYVAQDLWTSDGKSYGIVAVGGVLYMWVSPGSSDEAFQETRLFRSTDHGVSWSKAPWAFVFSDGIFTPTFLQFGKDYGGSKDAFVYVFAPERKTTVWDVQKPGAISLWRVPQSGVMERARYEFFAGLSSAGSPQWTASFAQRKTVFADGANGIMRTSVSFNPGLQRYLLITEHTARAKGNIGIYDAADPWGPWTRVLFEHSWGSPDIEPNTFFWNFSNKWLSADGKTFVLIFTGRGSNDSWNAVKGRFSLFRDGAKKPQ